MVYASQGRSCELLHVAGCGKVFIPRLQSSLCIQGGEFQLEFSEAARRLWLQLNQACTSLFSSCPPPLADDCRPDTITSPPCTLLKSPLHAKNLIACLHNSEVMAACRSMRLGRTAMREDSRCTSSSPRLCSCFSSCSSRLCPWCPSAPPGAHTASAPHVSGAWRTHEGPAHAKGISHAGLQICRHQRQPE